jgi:glycosyltransferase involved in cell wall biosynthesis
MKDKRDPYISTPKVSIVIPIFNSEETLISCLDSASQQTLNDIEIICVDDCSTDSSPDILANYSRTDTRLKVIHNSINKGEGAARNTGIENSTGEYIFHLDADDTLPSDAIQTLYTYAKKHDSDMVKGRYAEVYDINNIKHMAWSTPDNVIINTNIHESEFLQQIPTSHCTYLYKRDFINSHKIRYRTDILVGLDLIALATALIHAKKVTLVPKTVYYYHQTDTSTIRGNLSLLVAKDAIKSKSIVAKLLNNARLDEAADKRLQRWEYVIDTFMRRMPNDLSYDESKQVFNDFRNLINSSKIIPWTSNTPYQYRYTIALILSHKDEEALSFLDNNNAFDGDTDKSDLKRYLDFILKLVPEDVCSLMELGRLVRTQGDLEYALRLFENVIKLEPNNHDAQLQAAGTLIQLEQYEEARQSIDSLLDILTNELDCSTKIKGAATLKEHLGRNEFNKKLKSAHSAEIEALKSAHRTETKAARKELISINLELCKSRNELDSIYSSKSWKITAPLRKFMGIVKHVR